MHVYLKLDPLNDVSEIPEIVMLEFQGDIEGTPDEFKGLKLGDLTFENNKVIIDIGIHRAEGKKEKLAKPLLITKNKVESYTEGSLTVVGICREKIIFNKRPTPILDQGSKQVKKN